MDASPPQDNLGTAIAVLLAAAKKVNEAALGTIEDLSWDEAVELLADLRAVVRDHVGPIDASLVRHIYLTAPHGTTELDGVGVVTVARSKSRKGWDDRGVAGAILDAHLTDGTGEAPDPWDVVDWILDAAGINYWRVTPLRALGLRPDAFCTEEPGKPSVQIQVNG